MTSDDFPPTRAEGLRRLAAFVPHAGRAYAEGRNADQGAGKHAAVSQLSPYLRYRLVTEAEVAAAVLAEHKPAAAEFIQEVLWRTYWKGWLELRPAVWERFVAERDAAQAGIGGGLAKALAAAEGGTTGIDGFDDWAHELAATGYLHNHARMWFASIWIFTLRLPWTLGADFFLRHLIDADAASNTLSWRWVAGLQTAGKTYLATADNIARYTGGRFAPQGLATRAEALTEPPLRQGRAAAGLAAAAAGQALLLVTPDDLSPETLDVDDIAAVVVAAGTAGFPWGNRARTFGAAAVADTAARAGVFGTPVTTIDRLDATTIAAAARAAQVATVVVVEPPLGPVADALFTCQAALAADGITTVRLRRDWDEALWPFATKGFFAFRERIPDLLPALLAP